MILRLAQKIEVVQSNRQCKAGSIGYFICQDSVSKYNAWQMAAVFIRYGKKGKRRINILEFSTLMFDHSQFKESDKKILDTIQFVEGLFPRPSNSIHKLRKRFGDPAINDLGNSIIKPIDIECKNLLDLDTWDFLGYLTALSIYLYRLYYNKLSYQLIAMPLLPRLSEFMEHKDLRHIQPEFMGYYIIFGLDADIQNKNKSFEDSYLSLFDNQAIRKECLDSLIMAMIKVKDRDVDYKIYILQVYRNIEMYINDALTYYRKKNKELKSVQKSEIEYKNDINISKPISPRQHEILKKFSSTKDGSNYRYIA